MGVLDKFLDIMKLSDDDDYDENDDFFDDDYDDYDEKPAKKGILSRFKSKDNYDDYDDAEDNYDDYSFCVNNLFNDITIGSKTFKPITKFKKIKLICIDKNNAIIKGLKKYGIKG